MAPSPLRAQHLALLRARTSRPTRGAGASQSDACAAQLAVVWNSIYLQEVGTQLRYEGQVIFADELRLRFLPPARYQHINHFGCGSCRTKRWCWPEYGR